MTRKLPEVVVVNAGAKHCEDSVKRRTFIAKSVYAAFGAALASHSRGVSASEVEDFDCIVVGAGSSGCVLANRLSAAGKKVLLLEAGGKDDDKLIFDFRRFNDLQKTKFNWQYETEPEPNLDKRIIEWPRGKVLGGSSAINAMIYIRGHRFDYDHWGYLGNKGWGYEELLPLFKRSEQNATFNDRYHGRNGLLHVGESPLGKNALGEAFLAAAEECGLKSKANWDFNGGTQDGVAGYYQHTVKNGRRHSAASAFLTPFLQPLKQQLEVHTLAFVTKVLMDATKRAVGVQYYDTKNDELREARAVETILCAGAVDSPQLLMLSGLGPSDHLRSSGIDVEVNLPGVGGNLIDHPVVFGNYPSAIEFDGTIPCGGLFVRSKHCPHSSSPDLQFHPYGFQDPSGGSRFGFGPTLVRPKSAGKIRLASDDPRAAPKIYANYLSSNSDMQVMVEGVKQAREFARTKAFAGQLGQESGVGVQEKDMEVYIRQNLKTLYHPVGTCKMGNGADAVVDASLRVHGVEGLRVADASVMPTIINGNTNATCIMIGEKAAQLILDS